MKKYVYILIALVTILSIMTCASAEWLLPDSEGDSSEELQYKVGKTVNFGQYEQDNDEENGKEEIEWIVLENDGECATLISKLGLERIPYNKGYSSMVNWENCTLHEWLNNDFLMTAFSNEERNKLVWVKEAKGKVFLLSIDEAKHFFSVFDAGYLSSIDEAGSYFSVTEDLLCYPSDYAFENGTVSLVDRGRCSWWLRSRGKTRYDAAVVSGWISETGIPYCWVDADGVDAQNPRILVRPVIVLRFATPKNDEIKTEKTEDQKELAEKRDDADGDGLPVELDDNQEPETNSSQATPLEKGSNGEDVKRLQLALIEKGFLSGSADGKFGKMTEAAVKAAQKTYGLEQTGVADSALFDLLYK